MSEGQHCMSDNEIILENKIKKDRKSELYGDEQKRIFDEIIILLNNLKPDDETSYIDAPEIEKKKNDIMKYLSAIHKYFPCILWQQVKKVTTNQHLSIIRNILKHFNYKLKYKYMIYKKDGCIISYYRYYLINNISETPKK
jgi:hypothetical protein